MVEQTKKCGKCGKVKDVSLFNKNRSRSDGFHSECKACQKAHYEANREALLLKNRAYRQENREAILVKKRAYYQENREAILVKVKAYHKANKEARNEYNRAYHKANKEAIKSYKKANRGLYTEIQAAYKAKKKNNTPKFIRDCPVDKQRRVFAYNLARLLTETTGVEHHVDHMWPISDGGPHWSGNLQVIPAFDNLSKNASVDVEIKKTIKECLKYARQAYKKALEDANIND